MVAKKKLTKPNSLTIRNSVGGTCRSKKRPVGHVLGKFTINGEKFYVIPEKEYKGIVATAEIVTDPAAHKSLKEAFADPIKKNFSSIEEIEKELDSDDEWK